MDNNKNNIWMWVLVVVVVVLVLFLIFGNKGKESSIVEDSTDIVQETPIESVQDMNGTTGAGTVSLSYSEALIKYADRRIQLDKTCQARPNTVTYKDNTGIMIDNRSDQTRTVKVGTTYTIKPYGFKIVILPDIYLKSKTLLVDCDQAQNVATILVQE